MYGTWFATTLIGGLALIALIALFVGASPLFAVIFALLAVAFLGSLFVLRRGAEAVHRPQPRPRSGGEPVSGEGHASAGETAGQRASARR